uniref:Uncharacterized protein n=1 Tax=Peronospora matthiolae TaxID=2874970 RepID=A0AAV1UXV2_9STRA
MMDSLFAAQVLVESDEAPAYADEAKAYAIRDTLRRTFGVEDLTESGTSRNGAYLTATDPTEFIGEIDDGDVTMARQLSKTFSGIVTACGLRREDIVLESLASRISWYSRHCRRADTFVDSPIDPRR